TGASPVDERISRGALYPGGSVVLDHNLTLNSTQFPSNWGRSSGNHASPADTITAAAGLMAHGKGSQNSGHQYKQGHWNDRSNGWRDRGSRWGGCLSVGVRAASKGITSTR